MMMLFRKMSMLMFQYLCLFQILLMQLWCLYIWQKL